MPIRISRLPMPRLAMLLVALLVLATTQAALPDPALAASSTLAAACDGVNLRTRATTSAKAKVRLKAGAKVVATTKVTGGHWRTKCAGKTDSGNRWYRITSVNGKSVKSLYGVRYLYGARSLFKPAPITLATACDGVALRTGTSTSAPKKAKLDAGTKVVASTKVDGGSWSTTCAGSDVSGASWYRITSVGGKSVSSLYGVSYVYGASKLFQPPGAAPAPPPAPTPTPMPETGYVEGIDVSHWQDTIDWTAVAATGRAFAFMKASHDVDYADPTYPTNRAQANAAGLVIGAYHFARPDATPGNAVAQADWFVDTARPAPGDLRPVLDIEATGGLSSTDLQAWVQAFLDRVYERTGIRCLIYVSPNFWSNAMAGTTSFAANGYDTLWIAHWTTNPAPTVPASNWNGEGWTFWQYTSNGSVAGISGRVDLDRYRYSDFSRVTIP